MLRGLKIVLLFVLVFRMGIQVNSRSGDNRVDADFHPIKTECIQDQNTPALSNVLDIDEDELKIIPVLNVARKRLFNQPFELEQAVNLSIPYQTTVYYQSDSSPPNLLDFS